MKEIETIKINEIEYVRKEVPKEQMADTLNDMPYVIVRTYSAGVHAGYLKERNGKEVTLLKTRRFWEWYGSASLSQFAQSGTSRPDQCKFPEEVDKIILTEAIEILDVTNKAKLTIDAVKVWKS